MGLMGRPIPAEVDFDRVGVLRGWSGSYWVLLWERVRRGLEGEIFDSTVGAVTAPGVVESAVSRQLKEDFYEHLSDRP